MPTLSRHRLEEVERAGVAVRQLQRQRQAVLPQRSGHKLTHLKKAKFEKPGNHIPGFQGLGHQVLSGAMGPHWIGFNLYSPPPHRSVCVGPSYSYSSSASNRL
jgi:hypothetical protein